MTDRPILFSGPMVRALLDGRKTQTRRILANVPPMPTADCHPSNTPKHPAPYLDAYCGDRKSAINPRGMGPFWNWWQVDDRCCLPQFRIGYVPGDRLWVRETWQSNGLNWGKKIRDMALGLGTLHYAATDSGEWKPYWGGWKPGIYMPRKFSRLTLAVTDVRVERLQDISEADAIAEGVESAGDGIAFVQRSDALTYSTPTGCYAALWNDLNAKRGFGWDANPWVVALTFTVHHQNIDAPGAKEAA